MSTFTDIKHQLLQGSNLAIAVSIFIGIVAVFYILYNWGSYVFLKEKYHGVRFTTKNITGMTMLIAVSVSVTIVICMTVPIFVLPPIRIAVEGILVKMSGFIFGPVIGLIIGGVTELLVMFFVPSYIHPAYIIIMLGYGFFGGIASSFMRASKGNYWVTFGVINVFLLIYGVFILSIYGGNAPLGTECINGVEVAIPIKILKWEIEAKYFAIMFGVMLAAVAVITWSIVFVLHIKKKTKTLTVLVPILLLTISTEFALTILVSSWGEAALFGVGDDGYSAMVISRLIQAPFKIIFNTAVLFTTYKIIGPLIKRDF
ncbi:hypothetical protein STIUS_v1c00260 [Spiroplasma sp. TIUS-1]|uniref:hypothetical protein n=1 Tax=Spiroplasma sp. TIUS-1 TaxID=216963 RepID=UPI0013995645|nr:hypothetical protein [Spiroplasma sp. TIUS-1]QHX35581.1 hypothetical protein STIUS_v1c00260 [Spiroplasma sp. TIUS-1]